MSAYAAGRQDLPQRELSEPVRVADRPTPVRRSKAQLEAVRGVDGVLDGLLAAIADCVADAVVARLGREEETEAGEWLDSREAADYLGVHRDTLRRPNARSRPSRTGPVASSTSCEASWMPGAAGVGARFIWPRSHRELSWRGTPVQPDGSASSAISTSAPPACSRSDSRTPPVSSGGGLSRVASPPRERRATSCWHSVIAAS
jgi:hypothetical protein